MVDLDVLQPLTSGFMLGDGRIFSISIGPAYGSIAREYHAFAKQRLKAISAVVANA
jgi:hypothetical protein